MNSNNNLATSLVLITANFNKNNHIINTIKFLM